MAEITRERAGKIVRAVFEILADNPEGLQVRDVIEQLKVRVALTDYELGTYEKSPGTLRFDKIVRFSTIGAVKAGWMTKSKGTWTITDAGRAAYVAFPDPGDFMRESHRLYAEWRKAQTSDDDDLDDEIEAATATATLEEAEEAAWAEIVAHLREMPPFEFQDLVAALLRAMGYHVAWVSPPGPDKGIDIVAYTDPLGAEGPRIKVQVKRRNDHKTSVDDLRAFMAVLGGQDVGIYVATGGFTSDASSEARHQESRRITLLGPEALFDLWVQHYETLSDEDRQRMPLRPVYFLATDE